MHPQTYLKQNDRGIWEIKWQHRDARGRAHGRTSSTGQITRAAAERYHVEWRKAQSDALKALTSATVSEIVDGYLEDARRRGVRTSQSYTLVPVLALLGNNNAENLEGQPLQDYVAQRGGLVSDGTLRRELGALRAALGWAAKAKLIEKVPEIDRPSAAVFVERSFLEKADAARFLELALVWSNKRVGRFVALGLGTGARREAILDLTWDRVNLIERTIDFRVPGRKVTNKRRVLAVINERLLRFLEAIPPAERYASVVGAGEIRSCWATFVKTTPWPWMTAHCMRHTFITLGLRGGVTIAEMAELVGDTYQMIETHYWHRQADSRLRSAADKCF
jgi:integrase